MQRDNSTNAPQHQGCGTEDGRMRYQSFMIPTCSTVWMILAFALIIYMGHMYITAMIVVIQIFMARELFNFLRRSHEDRQLPGFRMLNCLPSEFQAFLREYSGALIVINDIAAFIFGFFFGRTPLIKLSPKKTWEGFAGASFSTIVSAFVFPWREISILPVQWHALVCLHQYGFFASGFKRAFTIKMVMAVFAYIYQQSFVVPQSFSVEMILDQILMGLSLEEQQALFMKPGQFLRRERSGSHRKPMTRRMPSLPFFISLAACHLCLAAVWKAKSYMVGLVRVGMLQSVYFVSLGKPKWLQTIF